MSKYYTIRNNKTKKIKIITFRKKFYTTLKSSHPWAVCTWIGVLIKQLRGLNGMSYCVDYDQNMELSKLLNTWESNNDVELHHIEKWFVDGTRLMDIENHFDVYVRFANMIYPIK